jgi:hypothetical protein
MKRLQQLSIAIVLSFLFSASTFAGDIGMPKASPPPPDPSSTTAPATRGTVGSIGIGYGSSDSVALIALGLMQTVLSVF